MQKGIIAALVVILLVGSYAFTSAQRGPGRPMLGQDLSYPLQHFLIHLLLELRGYLPNGVSISLHHLPHKVHHLSSNRHHRSHDFRGPHHSHSGTHLTHHARTHVSPHSCAWTHISRRAARLIGHPHTRTLLPPRSHRSLTHHMASRTAWATLSLRYSVNA